MHKFLLPMIGILTAALACGCNSAKSPAAVAADVAAARQQASTEVTDARKDAAKSVDSAAANVDGSSKDLNNASARAAYMPKARQKPQRCPGSRPRPCRRPFARAALQGRGRPFLWP